MRTYIAIDPGGTTGVVRYQPGYTPDHYQFPNTFDVADFVQDTWEAGNWTAEAPLTIIRERFTISKRTMTTTRQYDALYLNGWLIHHFRHLRPGDGLVLVQFTPAQGKGFSSNEKLKSVGWYWPGEGHANDAARHLLLGCVIDHTEGREDHTDLMTKLEGVVA